MSKTTQQIGAYGIVNGLGLHGDPKEKAKLLRRVRTVIERGDLGQLAEFMAAYGVGAWAGLTFRQVILGPRTFTEVGYWH